MALNTSELSALSYINKDFNTLYPEVLDLAKKLSYKWDPTISNESDPGVVLIKLLCLMADKLNFNIDTNILELFPHSVTQLENARQLYEQLGCPMRYYTSAETNISFAINTDKEKESIQDADVQELGLTSKEDLPNNPRTYTIPKFTMVSDAENKYVFTILEECTLSSNGVTTEVPAIQGVANQYSVNGETLITAANLDYENRLYFRELDIAQNGIFIESDDSSLDKEWTLVDNLYLQPLQTKCFKFGINDAGTQCYIEFPSDIATLIGNGIHITYIRTAGINGNISLRTISQLYSETQVSRCIEGHPENKKQTISISNDLLYVNNYLPALGGQEPETIAEVQTRYSRLKTTFETLVSLNDYTNYMISQETVSNGYVCDRLTDVQSSYKILEYDETTDTSIIHTKHTKEKTGTEGEETVYVPTMEAFDLKIYATAYQPNVMTSEQFNRTFEPIADDLITLNTDMNRVLEAFKDVKSVQHDFQNYEPDCPFMFINKYPIKARIVPVFKVNSLQQKEIINNVKRSLYQVLNAKKINFGDPIDYDLVYDTISGADSRIKSLLLDDIKYNTFAVYKKSSTVTTDTEGTVSNSEFVEVRIDADFDSTNTNSEEKNTIDKFRKSIYAKSVLAGHTQFLPKDCPVRLNLAQTNTKIHDNVSYITTNTELTVNRPIYIGEASSPTTIMTDIGTSESLSNISSSFYDAKIRIWIKTENNQGHIKLTKAGNDNVILLDWKSFSSQTNDIYIKTTFNTNETAVACIVDGVYDISTSNISIDIGNYANKDKVHVLTLVPDTSDARDEGYLTLAFCENNPASRDPIISDVLKEHENLILTAPALISKSPYTGYTKYLYNFNTPIENLNSKYDYTLSGDEWITFFYTKEEDGPYHFITYTAGATITPSFSLPTKEPDFIYTKRDGDGNLLAKGKVLTSESFIPSVWNLVKPLNNETVREDIVDDAFNVTFIYDDVTNHSTTATESLDTLLKEQLIGSDYTLSGTHSITPKEINKIEITPHIENKEQVGTTKVFWILSNPDNKLFTSSPVELKDSNNRVIAHEYSYVLKNDEYFMYSNERRTSLHLVGAGTELTLVTPPNTSSDDWWKCPKVTYEEFIKDWTLYLTDYCYSIDDKEEHLWATEQQFYQLAPGYKLKLKPRDELSYIDLKIDSSGTHLEDNISETASEINDFRNYDVSFIEDETSVETTLPYRNCADYAWKARTQLNIEMGPEQPQILLPHQSIMLYSADSADADKSPDSIEGGEIKPKDNNIYLLSDKYIDAPGGTLVDVRAYSEENDSIFPISIYTHEIPKDTISVDSSNSDGWSLNENTGKLTLTCPQNATGESSFTLDISLPSGQYVLPITTTSSVTLSLKRTLSDKTTSNIAFNDLTSNSGFVSNDDASSSTNLIGSSLMCVDLSEVDADFTSGVFTGKLTISFSEGSVIFGNPYKYNYTNPCNGLDFESVRKEVISLNKDNKGEPRFNYLYQVPEDSLIENPLDALSFTRKDHIFNKFTICQWVEEKTATPNILIENKVK